MGGNASHTMRVQLGQLPWVDCGAVRFEGVRALFALQGGLDISCYSAGIICGDLMQRNALVIDYVNRRLGLRRRPAAVPALAAAQEQQPEQRQQAPSQPGAGGWQHL